MHEFCKTSSVLHQWFSDVQCKTQCICNMHEWFFLVLYFEAVICRVRHIRWRRLDNLSISFWSIDINHSWSVSMVTMYRPVRYWSNLSHDQLMASILFMKVQKKKTTTTTCHIFLAFMLKGNLNTKLKDT